MTQPKVTISEMDGALGVLPPTSGRLYAVVGAAASGPVNVPASFGRPKDLGLNFTAGPGPEATAHFIEVYGRPAVFVRTADTVAGGATAVTSAVTGTSVPTADVAGAEPNDDYEVLVQVVAGGTVGQAGITYRWSLDGGRNMSALTALGTANTFTIPGSGVKVNLAAGTLVANDSFSFRTTAPQWNTAELGAALDALAASTLNIECIHIAGPIDANAFDMIETKIQGMAAKGKPRVWFGNTRMPTIGESEAAYAAAMSAAFATKATTNGALMSGAEEMTSSLTGRKYMRPVSFIAAAREAASSEEVNAADVNNGPLICNIKDQNGNPKHHDESTHPGLDDARFYVLRTVEGEAGVFVNRPRLFSPEGSDFQLVPHRRVLNLAHIALRAYFTRRLNKPVRVNAKTGFILEEEALEIESGARRALESMLLAKPKASAVQFALSRTDNLLSTKTLNGQARVVPLAYPEFIFLDLGFLNPALQVLPVAA